jgi:hypothetical protein
MFLHLNGTSKSTRSPGYAGCETLKQARGSVRTTRAVKVFRLARRANRRGVHSARRTESGSQVWMTKKVLRTSGESYSGAWCRKKRFQAHASVSRAEKRGRIRVRGRNVKTSQRHTVRASRSNRRPVTQRGKKASGTIQFHDPDGDATTNASRRQRAF